MCPSGLYDSVMCFPGPRNIAPDIYDGLVENLTGAVQGMCIRGDHKVTASIARKAVKAAIKSYMDEWLAHDEANEWKDWVESNYPEFDPEAGGDQDENGDEKSMREEFRYEKRQERLGWYYEDNGMGVIEKAAVALIAKNPATPSKKTVGAPRTKRKAPKGTP